MDPSLQAEWDVPSARIGGEGEESGLGLVRPIPYSRPGKGEERGRPGLLGCLHGRKGESQAGPSGKERREEAGRALRAAPMRKRGAGWFRPRDQPCPVLPLEISKLELNFENS